MRQKSILITCLVLAVLIGVVWLRGFDSSMQTESPGEIRRYAAVIAQDTLQQYKRLAEGLLAEARERNVYVQVIPVTSFQEQRNEVSRALYSGFDGMILIPLDGGTDGMDMLRETEASIPCLPLLDRLDRKDGLVCLSPDDAVGEAAVEELVELGYSPGKSLHIFVGSGDDTLALDRAAEFERALAERGYTADGTLTIDVNIISSDERIRSYILENDVEYIFCTDSLSTIAAAKCAYSVMYQRPDIIGCGVYEEHMQYYLNGSVPALLCTDYEEMGCLALELLDRYCTTGVWPEDYDLCMTVYSQNSGNGYAWHWSDLKNEAE